MMLFYRKYLLDSGYKTKEKESVKVEAIAAKSSTILHTDKKWYRLILDDGDGLIKEVGARPLIRVIDSQQICNLP